MNAASEIYVGLMSGTSLDGIDTAVVDFASFPPRVLHCITDPFPKSMQDSLKDLCRVQTTSLDSLYTLDARLGELYAESVNRALSAAGIEPAEVAAVGCHGQTLRHSPDSEPAYTVQIGDPNRIAVRCGLTTVADFRRKDIALGGQAAPLAPAFHRFLFHSPDEDRVVVNIGGIGNITCLPANPDAALAGFDTGPGNTLMDYWIGKHHGETFDAGGDWARSGQVIDELLERMLAEEAYFRTAAPKSTGTEYFSPAWLEKFLAPELDPADVQATLAELTAATIADAVGNSAAACYICGGGAENGLLLDRLRQRLPGCKVETTAALGINPFYVEAAAFAWLARERLALHGGNIVEITHASRVAVLGAVYAAD